MPPAGAMANSKEWAALIPGGGPRRPARNCSTLPTQLGWMRGEVVVMIDDGFPAACGAEARGESRPRLASSALWGRRRWRLSCVSDVVCVRDDAVPQRGDGAAATGARRVLGECDDDVALRGGQRVGPNSDSRCGRSTRLGSTRRRWQAGRGAQRAASADPAADPPTTPPPAQVVRDVGVVVGPGPEHRRTRCALYRSPGRRGDGRWPAARCGERAPASPMPRWRASVAHHASRAHWSDGLEQRPNQPVRLPRVVVGLDPGRPGQGVGDKCRRMREQDVCADTVVLTRRYAEHVR